MNEFCKKLKAANVTSVNAGYRTYSLHIKKGLRQDSDKLYGLTEFDDGKISLEENMDYETARETMLHELTHIVLELGGLGGSEIDDSVIPMKNEEMTTLISRGLLMLMNLNPKLFEIINEPYQQNP
jgi:Zn-dependent peptidase ImmA (M78 family)